MTTFGITRVKGDEDIIGLTVGHMLCEVDHVLAMDGGPEETSAILREFPISVVADDTPTYAQPEQMTALARKAFQMGAEWVVPFDADEIWLAKEPSISWQLSQLPPEVMIAEADLYDHRVTTLDDRGQADPIKRLQWRLRQQLPLRKVAARARDDIHIHGGNHGASYDGLEYAPLVSGVLQVRHFPYRTPEQFIRKIEIGSPALLAEGAPEDFGEHWKAYGRTLRDRGPEALREHFKEWFLLDDPEDDRRIVCDPCPVSSYPLPVPAPIGSAP